MRYLSLLITFFALFFVNSLFAQNYQSHYLENNVLIIKTDEGVIKLTPYHKDIIAVDYQASNYQQLPSYAISKNVINMPVKVEASAKQLNLLTDNLTVKISKHPIQISYSRKGQSLIEEEQGFFADENVQGFRFRLSKDEKLAGGGERVLGMDRRGHTLPLYNKAHYGYGTHSKQMYFGLPALLSSKRYMLLFDNTAKGALDIGDSEADILQFIAEGGRTSYIIVAGDSYPDIIKNYTYLTGRQPLPPRWAMGNFASRFGYHSESEARQVVEQFIEKDFPLDAVVLDLYWFGKDIQGHMGNLDWDKSHFPTPLNMMSDFKKQGVNTVVITEPFVLTTSNRWQSAVQERALAVDKQNEPKTFDFFFGNSGLIDVFNPKGQQWFANIYRDLHKQGVNGWWGDLGEPEVHPEDAFHLVNGNRVSANAVHNVFGHQWAELVYNTQKQIDSNSRVFLLMRSGFLGSQRFGMMPWTGDVSRSWQGLKPQVELSLQMGLFGLAYTHSDLGGFAGGEQFDAELYTRWLQYGTFQPIYRPHAHEAIAPEPIFHDEDTQDIVRKFIKLRYQMLPYNYSLVYENSLTGMPLMRPMLFDSGEWFDEKEQFFWGNSFLVKPITDAGVKQVSVKLPQGVWFDFWNNTRYLGEQTVQLKTSLETIPVLVKAGAFVPMIEPIQSTAQYQTDKLTIHYYADQQVKRASGVMYDDDGSSADTISKNNYQKLHFSAEQLDGNLSLSAKVSGKFKEAPKERQLSFVIHNWLAAPSSIYLVDKKKKEPVVFSYDAGTKTLIFSAKLSEYLTMVIDD